MAALSGSVIGVSRSGRVRKKSAKLMEMEDSTFGDETESSQTNRRKSSANTPTTPTNASHPAAGGGSGTIHISYIPQVPRDRGASYLNPKCRQSSSASGGASSRKQSASTPASKAARKTPPVSSSSSTSPPSKKRKKQQIPHLEEEREVVLSPTHGQSEERVIAIKHLSPTYDTLSGSAYLMGEDLHFITGEAVASNDEESMCSNNEDLNSSEQLKVDVGFTEEPSVSVSEESGLKIKFILSPKTGIKATKSEKGKSGKSSSSKKKKSSKSKKGSSHGTMKSKSKAKKKSHSASDDVAALDLLASGGILPDNDESIVDENLSEEIEDDYMGATKLVIAEPRPLELKTKKKKKKKSSSKEGAADGNGDKKSGKKSKSKTNKASIDKEMIQEDVTATEMVPALPQSLYFKEKNSTKKKFNKKSVAKPKEKPEKKQRPISAYMLWSQEYRKIIVSENPGFDFAQISRRLGEIWQSYPDKEKMQWRSKAKLKSGKLAIMNNSNLINTSRKPAAELSERVRPPPALKPVMAPTKPMEDLPLSPKDINKVVGTSPLDVAAHLKLLGESLGTIGQRLTQHEGQIAVSGSLSVLLDSTLCALGPLLCLTSEIDQLNGCPKEVHQKILDNVAYIMPGL